MNNLTVVHANELVEASYSLSINELRVIALACTKIDSRKSSSGDIYITVREFLDSYQIENNRAYGDLRDAVKGIMRKPIRLFDPEKDKYIELSWLVKNEYERDPGNGSHVSIQFSPLIKPYLFELKERFTRIDFKYVSKLNTPFSFRLYQWLKRDEKLARSKKREAVVVELSVDWMKTQAALTGYERWDNFKHRVIQPAVDKINHETDLSVIWEPVRKGRTVSSVKFSYVVEVGSVEKPNRPRLYRRPKVLKGSHEEGIWMRKNLSLLLDYEEKIKAYDPQAKMALPDLRKMVEYAKIVDSELESRLKNEISSRVSKVA
ncbi:TPA: replication initiation protein [Vibrio parahaemolyticus]|nr:replication initiation protein [Vibrio parahaemolyticus]